MEGQKKKKEKKAVHLRAGCFPNIYIHFFVCVREKKSLQSQKEQLEPSPGVFTPGLPHSIQNKNLAKPTLYDTTRFPLYFSSPVRLFSRRNVVQPRSNALESPFLYGTVISGPS
ncbi:hypothetical protein CDAR_519101 [Caerostris darwini]|uniref:Uncharacterized protein n=1 Tax=Caerostris darwini TaxID=1538125 RepID=A0AAV4NZY7_9ARAC|nr:hypothetical protein CDAR_519101 [Caerostris darwini]